MRRETVTSKTENGQWVPFKPVLSSTSTSCEAANFSGYPQDDSNTTTALSATVPLEVDGSISLPSSSIETFNSHRDSIQMGKSKTGLSPVTLGDLREASLMSTSIPDSIPIITENPEYTFEGKDKNSNEEKTDVKHFDPLHSDDFGPEITPEPTHHIDNSDPAVWCG